MMRVRQSSKGKIIGTLLKMSNFQSPDCSRSDRDEQSSAIRHFSFLSILTAKTYTLNYVKLLLCS